MAGLLHSEECPARRDTEGLCNCMPPPYPDPWDPAVARKFQSDVLAMSPGEKTATLEFRAAAVEARTTAELAQKAAARYAKAVKALSEVVAPPTEPTE